MMRALQTVTPSYGSKAELFCLDEWTIYGSTFELTFLCQATRLIREWKAVKVCLVGCGTREKV